MTPSIRRLAVVLATLLGTAGTAYAQQDSSAFPHPKHAKVFLACQTCHPGVRDSTARMWPTSTECAECHDGQVEKTVSWTGPTTRAPNNLKFTHARHAAAFTKKMGADSVQACTACHAASGTGAAWMDVGPPLRSSCFSCHGLHSVAHLAAPDTACVKCHVPLAKATGLTMAQISDFPAPPSHDSPNFVLPGGHGRAARAVKVDGKRQAIAPSCTVCHAQDFCAACHVNSQQVTAIQALARDPRSLALGPKQIRPSWHGPDFSNNHAKLASGSPATCATCHQRTECLDCHRPNPGDGQTTYHNAGYLAKHPVDAYSRSADCSQCHNTGYFCSSCHQQSGLVSNGPLHGGYHNSAQFFALGHGKAAREALETCVSCHTENDCMRCHSAIQGRHFNPHGPDFDASKLKSRNPQMCSACHGRNIPG
jgi:hypothetical protein